MKRILLVLLMLICVNAFTQTTYYWVGGTTGAWSSSGSWNTMLNGSGSARTTANTGDKLIFDGTNIGGSVPATGVVTPAITGSATIGQLYLQNGAQIVLQRSGTTGTATFTINGEGTSDDDLLVDATSVLTIANNAANFSFVLQVGTTVLQATGKISGTVNVNGSSTSRLVAMNQRAIAFESGSVANVNLTAASAYPFGSATQTVEKAIIFKSGSALNYLGGNSPMGNQAAFSSLEFMPGSTWYHKANNAGNTGSFFNSKSFGNIVVQNNATLQADGPIYRIYDLTIDAGATFITHTTGHTALLGNLTVNGTYTAQALVRSNTLVFGGISQTVSGAGAITIPSLTIANGTEVNLNRSIDDLDSAVLVYGKLNFNSHQLNGDGDFSTRVNMSFGPLTGNFVADSFQVRPVVGAMTGILGLTVTGTGIAPGTRVVGFTSGGAMMALSKPVLSNGTNVTLNFHSDTAVLVTSNVNGFADNTGSVNMTDTKSFQTGTSYIINGATSTPFGVSTGAGNDELHIGFAEINAPVTLNRSIVIYQHLTVNSKVMMRLNDTIHIEDEAVINGSFGASSYISMAASSATGEKSIIRYDGVSGQVVVPTGTSTHFLPLGLQPITTSDFNIHVFEGITTNGQVNGTPFTPAQKQTVVDAVWNIERLTGSGDVNVGIGWTTPLEGSTFITMPNSDIGLIRNTGSSWALPVGTADNLLNIAGALVTDLGSFSAGAVPPTQPFIFNPLPVKTYGDPDFNGGATSLNTTQPIVYSSSNPAVATIVGGNIHITGAGTTDITATQATDGQYPSASVTQTLTVNKAELTITADNKLKFEGQANPVLTATYTGFVLGENASVLTSPAVLNTTAVTASPAGMYPITVSGATANNYNITFVPGTLTVQPRTQQVITFNALPVKTYGNADFAAGATSTNNTIPITYASSNTSVATVTGNIIHISGAGTTTITASQAGNAGFFPATDVSRTLTVNKANLTIRVRDTSRVEGQPNPPFTITYTGFVLGENVSNLTSPPVATTTAVLISPAGYYPITLGGANSNNYNITYVNGRLTVFPLGGTDQQNLHAFMSNSSTMTVRIFSPEPKIGDITVWDMSGKPVARKNVFMPAGFINTDLKLPLLPNGIYVVTVKGDGIDLKKTIPVIR